MFLCFDPRFIAGLFPPLPPDRGGATVDPHLWLTWGGGMIQDIAVFFTVIMTSGSD